MTGFHIASMSHAIMVVICLIFALFAIRFERITLFLLMAGVATLFARLSVLTWNYGETNSTLVNWLSRPQVIVLHNAVLAILMVGVMIELIIRETTRFQRKRPHS